MRGPIRIYLDRFCPNPSDTKQGNAAVKRSTDPMLYWMTHTVIPCLNWLVGGSFLVAFILYIVAAAYPSWPLFEQNQLYWSMHLVAFPWTLSQMSNDASTHASLHVMQTLAMLTMLLLIHPFILMCVEAYLCNQLNDAEKLSVATCAAAYTDNYIDVNSQLACANLINVDITSIAHGSCAYLINHVASAVQAFEFIALVLFTFKDALIYFAMDRAIRQQKKNNPNAQW